jgi:hypothetical protein
VPLAILAASLSSRIRYLGFARVPGVLIASSGGILASGMLATSALAQWVLSRPATATNSTVVRPLADGGLLPRPVWIVGIAFAAIAELSTIALLSEPAAVLLPIARFGGLAWLLVAAALLPTSRHNTSTTTHGGITP